MEPPSAAPAATALPAALARALDAVPSPGERARVAALFDAAARAIEALGDLDLAGREGDPAGSADLSAWEALAPLAQRTFLAVGAFLDVVGTETGEATGSAPTPLGAAIRDRALALTRDRTAFGEGLRRPDVAADRWNLLAHVGEYRGKFRLGIGELVYRVARRYAPVARAEAIPFYRAEQDDAVLVRRALSLVHRSLRADLERFRKSPAGDGTAAAAAIRAQLDTFFASRAFRLVRPHDKREFLGIHGTLATPGAGHRRLAEALESLDRLFLALQAVNRRAILVAHDREARDAALRRLARAKAALAASDPAAARAEAAVALSTAQRLLGRDAALDALLLSLRRTDPRALDDGATRRLVAALRERLSGVELPPESDDAP